MPSLNSVNVSATGGTLNFSAAMSLTNVNLTAGSGGQLLFPVATSLRDNGDTIQASGNGSYINLSAPSNLTDNGNYYWTSVTASTGGNIALAGNITSNVNLTLSDAASNISVAGVTSVPARQSASTRRSPSQLATRSSGVIQQSRGPAMAAR